MVKVEGPNAHAVIVPTLSHATALTAVIDSVRKSGFSSEATKAAVATLSNVSAYAIADVGTWAETDKPISVNITDLLASDEALTFWKNETTRLTKLGQAQEKEIGELKALLGVLNGRTTQDDAVNEEDEEDEDRDYRLGDAATLATIDKLLSVVGDISDRRHEIDGQQARSLETISAALLNISGAFATAANAYASLQNFDMEYARAMLDAQRAIEQKFKSSFAKLDEATGQALRIVTLLEDRQNGIGEDDESTDETAS